MNTDRQELIKRLYAEAHNWLDTSSVDGTIAAANCARAIAALEALEQKDDDKFEG